MDAIKNGETVDVSHDGVNWRSNGGYEYVGKMFIDGTALNVVKGKATNALITFKRVRRPVWKKNSLK